MEQQDNEILPFKSRYLFLDAIALILAIGILAAPVAGIFDSGLNNSDFEGEPNLISGFDLLFTVALCFLTVLRLKGQNITLGPVSRKAWFGNTFMAGSFDYFVWGARRYQRNFLSDAVLYKFNLPRKYSSRFRKRCYPYTI